MKPAFPSQHPRLRGAFVTGTDTGVGKTAVACALLRELSRGGPPWTPWKPAETGVASREGTDALRLARAAGMEDAADRVGPLRLALPASPRRAARSAGLALTLDAVISLGRPLAALGRPVLVEGAGGLLVPLTARETFADLAAALGLPALVVARDALGTVNHTALTVEALRRRGIPLVGVVLNAVDGVDASALDNASELREILDGAPVFGPLPWGPDGALDAAARACGLVDAVRSAADAP